MNEDAKIVVIGAGQASAQLAESLRKGGHTGPITLIGEERWLPYQRPPLSKAYLLGDFDRERLFVKPASFYEERGITLRLGTAATGIDRAARSVSMADGSSESYDQLAILTGSRVRRIACPGAELEGVHYVRGIDDIDALVPAIERASEAVVIGGGYIGLEAAAVLRKRGLGVTVLEREDRLLARVASPATSGYVQDMHEAEGVRIETATSVTGFAGEGRIEAVETDQGRFAADLVIVGIGVIPNAELATDAGIETGNGIAVDSQCRTSDPAIFAAGDVAEFPLNGARLRLESVQNALDQAKACASAMLGGDAPYAPVPWFWSDQYDAKLQSVGLGTGFDQAVIRDNEAARSVSVWLYLEGRLLAVEAMNDPRSYMMARRWLEQGQTPDPKQIADPSQALKEITCV